jgi:hypothetical protein
MSDDLLTWATKAKNGIHPIKAKPSFGVTSDDLSWIDPIYRDQIRGWGTAKRVPGNPPAWVASPSIWNRAREAVEKGHWERYDEPWAVVAHVYRNMGGGVK